METFELLILLLLLAVIGILVYVFFFKKEEKKDDSNGLLMLQQQLHDLTRTMDERMGESNKTMQEGARIQFRESKELIQEINKEVNEQLRNVIREVTTVSESSKQVFTVAESLKNLEKVLKHQKQRGNLGEASLELILSNMLSPTEYKIQHLFPGGDVVDAVVVTKEGLIPVDAKFSLDNYNRLANENDEVRKEELAKEFRNDLKKRIDETAKYIRPKDGTLPFAFMYIPAEGIYYDLLVNDVEGAVKVNSRSLIDYAYKEKNVIIVSPTTFSAYLQSVLYGFRALRFQENMKDIQKNVEQLMRHLSAYEEYYKKLGNTLSTTVNHYNTGYKELGKIDKDILRITDSSAGITVMALEKPQQAE